MASSIGIKIANGEFYHIVEENSQVKKRLVLTTVHDNQRSVQIDLYKSPARTMADATYIGSLVLENVKPRPKGEPSIELIISSTQNGDITADAVEMDAAKRNERQTLNVSLKSMDEDDLGSDIPDFELDKNDAEQVKTHKKSVEVRYGEKKKGFPWLVVILAALVLAAIGIVVWLYFFQWKGSPTAVSSRPSQIQQVETEAPPIVSAPPAQIEAPALPAQPVQVEEPKPVKIETPQPAQANPPPTQQSPPVIQAPAKAPVISTQSRKERNAPVLSYNVPSTIPSEGAPYKIRYGDTLWDIADAFYRNPWLFPRIARFNNILNPDLIISGTTILVPPKN